MRDRKAYIDAGRNDPLDDPQRLEHPYDFVSLPDAPALGMLVGHAAYPKDRLSGQLHLVYETLTPLHVGSGVLERAEDCGLAGGDRPVRGITRSAGRPVLPGSGWKGAVRSRYEAITRSRLGTGRGGRTTYREPAVKVPQELRQGGDQDRDKYTVQLADPQVGALQPLGTIRNKKPLPQLSPAESLFGAMGYRGRVFPGEGRIEGPAATRAVSVAPMDGPMPHRLAQPGAIRQRGKTLTIQRVEGRKFYYNGEVQSQRLTGARSASEPVDSVPAGSQITLEVHLESITLAELGALLLAAGYGEDAGIVRFGGFKPAGLGAVRLKEATARLGPGAELSQWRRSRGEKIDLDQAVSEAHDGLVDNAALAELHQITTRRRPASGGR